MSTVHNNALAVLFAFTSALTIAIGTVWRHQIVLRYSAEQEGSSGAIGAIRRPTWWLSLSLAWLAYGFQAVALAFGTLLVVQPVLVLSLLLTLVLSAKVERRGMETMRPSGPRSSLLRWECWWCWEGRSRGQGRRR